MVGELFILSSVKFYTVLVSVKYILTIEMYILIVCCVVVIY